MRVLVVEDDFMVAEGLKQNLQLMQYSVDVAGSAEQAWEHIHHTNFDIALVDLGLPETDGLTFIRQMRQKGLCLPILVLTARDSLEETVHGLDAGADDYLAKPYQMPEVAARIRALLRRSRAVVDACIRHNELCLNTRTRVATLNDQTLELTNREWRMLEILLSASPDVVSKETLTNNLARWDKDITPNAIEVYLSRLRNKLGDSNVVIRTVRGIGYRIDAPEN